MRRISVFVILLCMSIVASSCDSKNTNVSETSSTSEVVETQVVTSDVTTVETEEVVATSSSETETTETEATETEETEPSVSETSVEETEETEVSETSETTVVATVELTTETTTTSTQSSTVSVDQIPWKDGMTPPEAPNGYHYELIVSIYGEPLYYQLEANPETHTKEEWMQIQGISSYTNSDGVVVYGYYVDTSCLDTATNDYRESIGLPRLTVVSSDTYFAGYCSSAKQACIDSYDSSSSYWHKCTNLTGYGATEAFNAFYNSQGHREGMEKNATMMSSISFDFYKYIDDVSGFKYLFTWTVQLIN